jgi:hypothetical protein
MSKDKDDWNISLLPLDEALGDDGTATSRVLRTIEGQHLNLSQQLVTFYTRRKSWLHRLFPTKLDKILLDGQLNLAKSECELNERILQLACSMKLEACREVADVWIKSMKVETRETFFNFVSDRTLRLQETIERRRVQFGEHIKKRYATAERYRDMPEFFARYVRSIEDEIEGYLGWLDELLGKFQAIVQERVAQYDRPTLPS